MTKLEQAERLDGIRQRVRVGIEEADAGQCTRYQGRAGPARLASQIKAESRRLAARRRRDQKRSGSTEK
jgi:hypothetical protein